MDMDGNTTTSKEQEAVPALGAAFFTALRFLTVIPVSWQAENDARLFKKSVVFFPFVALVIGALGAAVAHLAGFLFPERITAFILLVYLAAISGFLHVDGLADSADGLFSARPADTALQIMKDSRIGAMGVVVLVLVFMGKYSALSLLTHTELVAAAMLLPLAGRGAILLTMASQPYGRKEGGLGELFYSSRSRLAALSGVVLLAAVSGLTLGLPAAFGICLCVLMTVVLFSWFCRSRLGGVTGDTLGAVCEITELTAAITICTM